MPVFISQVAMISANLHILVLCVMRVRKTSWSLGKPVDYAIKSSVNRNTFHFSHLFERTLVVLFAAPF